MRSRCYRFWRDANCNTKDRRMSRTGSGNEEEEKARLGECECHKTQALEITFTIEKMSSPKAAFSDMENNVAP